MAHSSSGIAGFSRHALFAGVAALALPVAAHAQDNAPAGQSDNGEDVETAEELEQALGGNTIVVTATKREQTLQEAPVSVSVTTGETLERAEIRDLIDVQTVTPSLRVSQLQNSSTTTFIIRGFGNGDNNFGVEPSVGVFIDGVFRSRSAGAIGDLANVNRIEVLRGPQSTLFGKNASAGVVSVITREPQFDFGGSVSATYGNFNQFVLKGDLTGPLTDDLAFAISGGLNKRDGYAEVIGFDEKLNDRNRWNARADLLFDNGGPLRMRAIGDYSKIDEICCQVNNLVAGPTTPLVFAAGGNIITNDFFGDTAALNLLPVNEVESYGLSWQADLDLDTIGVTAITAYRVLDNFFNQDVDFTGLDFIREFRDQKAKTFTQEVRVTSDFDGPFNFLLGGFYFNEDQAVGYLALADRGYCCYSATEFTMRSAPTVSGSSTSSRIGSGLWASTTMGASPTICSSVSMSTRVEEGTTEPRTAMVRSSWEIPLSRSSDLSSSPYSSDVRGIGVLNRQWSRRSSVPGSTMPRTVWLFPTSMTSSISCSSAPIQVAPFAPLSMGITPPARISWTRPSTSTRSAPSAPMPIACPKTPTSVRTARPVRISRSRTSCLNRSSSNGGGGSTRERAADRSSPATLDRLTPRHPAISIDAARPFNPGSKSSIPW